MCLCRKECVLQIGIDRGEVVLEISKELLIKDLKEFNSIDKLFLFFTSAQGDAEYCEEAKQCYKELKWTLIPF